MTPRDWCHTRRTARLKQSDQVESLINTSAHDAASGKLLRASRMLRYVEQLTRLRKRRRPPIAIDRPPTPTPVKTPRAPLVPLTAADLPYVRAAYTDEEKARLTGIYRRGGIEHLMPPFDE